MTKMRGCPGTAEVRLDLHPSRLVERHAERRGERVRAARPPPRAPPSMRSTSSPRRTRPRLDGRHLRAGLAPPPPARGAARRRSPRGRRGTTGGCAARPRGGGPSPPSGRCCRKSRSSTNFDSSARAPASSTPVGPSADDDEAEELARRSPRRVSRSASSKASSTRCRISIASSIDLRPGAALAQSSWPKYEVRAPHATMRKSHSMNVPSVSSTRRASRVDARRPRP